MADSDVDGAHIRTLILTFLFKYFPELIVQGHVFCANPPLYSIKIKNKYIYTSSEEDKAKYGKQGNADITYLKGLGELDPEQLWETTMDPKNRQLYQITMDDAEAAENVFNTLMGSKVEPRKNFIVKNSYLAEGRI